MYQEKRERKKILFGILCQNLGFCFEFFVFVFGFGVLQTNNIICNDPYTSNVEADTLKLNMVITEKIVGDTIYTNNIHATNDIISIVGNTTSIGDSVTDDIMIDGVIRLMTLLVHLLIINS